MRRLTRFLSLLVVPLAVISTMGQQRTLQVTDLLGSYSHSGSFAGSTITIEAEGKFHINSSDCTQEFFDAGTYTFKNGILHLQTTRRTVKSHGETDDQARNLLDPKVYEEEYREKPPADDRINELVPVTWGDRIYLMHKSDFFEFSNAINLGLEPRKALGTEWYLGSFYLRNGDENQPVSGRPSLPAETLSQLLENPVETQVRAILQEGDAQLAVIDKGSEVGLKPGMRFVINDEGYDPPNLWFKGLIVVSVDSHLAKLKILPFLEIKIGDKVSSKFADRRFQ